MTELQRDCAVILVNYRQPALTEQAVASLRRADGFARMSVYIVDNDSRDGSYERLQASCPDCTVLASGANLGFSGGNNVGICAALAADAKWVLLLNNDAEVDPKFLAPLLFAATDGRTIVSPLIVYAAEPTRIWYGGGYVSRGRGGFYHETDVSRAVVPRDVTFASGCCLLIPAPFFKENGLMDEDYFLYYEDAALCKKALKAGYSIRYEPKAVVLHKVSASTGQNSPLTAYYGTRNRLALLRRFAFPWWSFVFVLGGALAKLILRSHRWSQVAGLVDGFRLRMGPRRDVVRPRIAFNGCFVGRRVSGLERFALETLRALDCLMSPGEAELLVPRKVRLGEYAVLQNIKVRRVGLMGGPLWEQLSLPLYAWRRRLTVVSLTNTVPLLRPGIACIHDVFYMTHAKELGRTLRGRLSVLWHKIHYRRIAKCSARVLTVSRYSAGQITRYLGVPSARLYVLGNGWEHMSRIAGDAGIFSRLPSIRRGEYLLALGNDLPYKNLRWLISQMAYQPDLQLIVAGKRGATTSDLSNVIFAGYVTDGEMRALMEGCRALVLPSLDEGFGIPPLEALALGRPAIVIRTSCLPEVYGSTVHYVDPPLDERKVDLPALLTEPVLTPEPVLREHSWARVAKSLKNIL